MRVHCDRRTVIVATAGLTVFGTAAGQHVPDAAAINAIFAQYDTPSTPGCALGVYRDGAIV